MDRIERPTAEQVAAYGSQRRAAPPADTSSCDVNDAGSMLSYLDSLSVTVQSRDFNHLQLVIDELRAMIKKLEIQKHEQQVKIEQAAAAAEIAEAKLLSLQATVARWTS
ncbi:uncharacterized protein LTR77_001964 [Saxophila tyrrhenica]|uniref:Uncharacterized protein n=1 Tax=Saxophila tyrrhenica TaxID=1690608 RepID=A0AAV9PI39_9PEZI|nr:hypothetical protein LTR77_001964 [Saxophila tyrrhenica]